MPQICTDPEARYDKRERGRVSEIEIGRYVDRSLDSKPTNYTDRKITVGQEASYTYININSYHINYICNYMYIYIHSSLPGPWYCKSS